MPGAVLAGGCPDLSGTYATRADGAYPEEGGTQPPLDELLGPGLLRDAQELGRPWPGVQGAASATFTSSGDRLQVRFHGGAQPEAALEFRRKQWWGGSTEGAHAMYQCLELELGPAAGFDAPRRRIAAVPYLFAKGDLSFVFLSKARDGSLVANYRTERVFITSGLIGSHARWVGSVWWRYPSVMPTR